MDGSGQTGSFASRKQIQFVLVILVLLVLEGVGLEFLPLTLLLSCCEVVKLQDVRERESITQENGREYDYTHNEKRVWSE